jgi:hypothetical protein
MPLFLFNSQLKLFAVQNFDKTSDSISINISAFALILLSAFFLLLGAYISFVVSHLFGVFLILLILIHRNHVCWVKYNKLILYTAFWIVVSDHLLYAKRRIGAVNYDDLIGNFSDYERIVQGGTASLLHDLINFRIDFLFSFMHYLLSFVEITPRELLYTYQILQFVLLCWLLYLVYKVLLKNNIAYLLIAFTFFVTPNFYSTQFSRQLTSLYILVILVLSSANKLKVLIMPSIIHASSLVPALLLVLRNYNFFKFSFFVFPLLFILPNLLEFKIEGVLLTYGSVDSLVGIERSFDSKKIAFIVLVSLIGIIKLKECKNFVLISIIYISILTLIYHYIPLYGIRIVQFVFFHLLIIGIIDNIFKYNFAKFGLLVTAPLFAVNSLYNIIRSSTTFDSPFYINDSCAYYELICNAI